MSKEGKHNVLVTLGTKDGSTTDREENDFYATSPKATNLMVDWLEKEIPGSKNWKIWECCCGNGRLAETLKERGHTITGATDLIDRGYGTQKDFLVTSSMENNSDAIITNPPYSCALEIAEHAMSLLNDGQYYIFLGRIQFLEGKARKKFFEDNPPKYVLVHSERVNCWKNDKPEYNKKGKEITSAMCYSWFVFEKGYKGKPMVCWL